MEQEGSGGVWTAVRSDSHPSTTFEWVRNDTVLGTSTVTLSWTIEDGTPGAWIASSFSLLFFAKNINRYAIFIN